MFLETNRLNIFASRMLVADEVGITLPHPLPASLTDGRELFNMKKPLEKNFMLTLLRVWLGQL